jgi:hypothetical protein
MFYGEYENEYKKKRLEQSTKMAPTNGNAPKRSASDEAQG